MAPVVLKDKWVAFVSGADELNRLITREGKNVLMDTCTHYLLSEVPHYWSVFIAVFCRDQYGKTYMKAEEHRLTTKYIQRQVVDYFNTEHSRIFAAANQNHVIGVGYLASPMGDSLRRSEAFHLFEKLGGFNRWREPTTGNIYVVEPWELKELAVDPSKIQQFCQV